MVYFAVLFFFLIHLPLLFFLCSKKKKSDVIKKNTTKTTAGARKSQSAMPRSKSQLFPVADAQKKPLADSLSVIQKSDSNSKPEHATAKPSNKKLDKKTSTTKTKGGASAKADNNDDDLKFGPPPEESIAEETDLTSLKDMINPLLDRKVQARLTRPRDKPNPKTVAVAEMQKEAPEASSDQLSQRAPDASKATSKEKSDSDKEMPAEDTKEPSAECGPRDSLMLPPAEYKSSDDLTKVRLPSAVEKRKSRKSQKEKKPPLPALSPRHKISEMNAKLTKKNKGENNSAYL